MQVFTVGFLAKLLKLKEELIFFPENLNNKIKLKALKNIHKDKRCFIIGNGPSLNKCDLTKLKNEITFGVNAIYLNYDKMGFSPTYYVVEDVCVATDRAEEIKEYQGPKIKFFGTYLKKWLNGAKNTYWLNYDNDYNEKDSKWPYFSGDAAKVINVTGTVTYACLQLAFYMGFKEVYLIGFDHSYVIPKEDMVSECKIISTREDVNHFHPDYFGKGKSWHDPRVDRMERGYKKALEYFEKNGKKIFNATVEGNLEIFQRVNFDELFSER